MATGIAWNTGQLLCAATSDAPIERTPVEYHLRSWRELYDKAILSADRHHSSAGEWVVHGDGHFYTVSVTSRPVYTLPQELCLSFDCCTLIERGETASGSYISQGPPIEEVARDFLVLLSAWAREPLVPLGIRRQDNRPITGQPQYPAPPRPARGADPRACGIDGPAFRAVLRGMANAPSNTIGAVLGAARFYHSALSQVGFDPSGAYVALVSAIECLAGHHYPKKRFPFAEVKKFDRVRGLLGEITNPEGADALRASIEEELLRNEHFVWQKFLLLITEYLTDEFWTIPDELYPHNTAAPPIPRGDFKWCLRRIYNGRSKYVHGGRPFPAYADFGTRDRYGRDVLIELQKLIGQKRYLPLFSWFERLTHLVIVEYMLRAFAPEQAQARTAECAEKERLLGVMAALPANVKASLRNLTQWTAGFAGSTIVNAHAPNKGWADSPETVAALAQAGLITCEDVGLDGSAWLCNREVGAAAGEFVFGAANNPLRGNEILLPRAYESIFGPAGLRDAGDKIADDSQSPSG